MRMGQAEPRWCSFLQETWEQLLASSKYNEQESFAVVFQPFFYERALPPPSVSEGLAHTHPLPLPPPPPPLPSPPQMPQPS